MNRNLLINIHVWVSSFFIPAVLLMALSGGLYLIGIKGSTEESSVSLPEGTTLDPSSDALEDDVRRLLAAAGVDHSFEYIKKDGDTLITRPTSRVHYTFQVGSDGVIATRVEPDLQSRMMELHMGHGPLAFKNFQKFLAAGLLLIVITGFSLGLTRKRLRSTALAVSGAGVFLFLYLVLWA